MKYIQFTFKNTSKCKRIAKRERLIYEYSSDSRIHAMDNFIQHGSTTTLEHVQNVAKTCYDLNHFLQLGLDDQEIIETAMLHDYYLYDWHKKRKRRKLHGFHHAFLACKNAARDFHISDIQQQAILSHMWPLNLFHLPKTKLAVLLCISDKYCALSETIQGRIKKVK